MAVLSKGTKIYIGDDSDPVQWTAIPGVTRVAIPDPSKDEIDVSDLESNEKEYISGLGDGGEVSYPINVKKNVFGNGFHAAHEALEDARDSRELRPFKISVPTGKHYFFNAFVKSFAVESETNAQIRATLVLRVSGSVTREVDA